MLGSLAGVWHARAVWFRVVFERAVVHVEPDELSPLCAVFGARGAAKEGARRALAGELLSLSLFLVSCASLLQFSTRFVRLEVEVASISMHRTGLERREHSNFWHKWLNYR